jgi:hypothetical protein
METNEDHLFSNHELFLELLKDLKAFKSRDWYQTGFEHGISRHSHQSYNAGVDLISNDLKMHFSEVSDKLAELILKSAVDLFDAGPEGASRHVAELKKQFWDEKLTYCRAMAVKDHANERASEFHTLILAYRSGFNEGHRVYLKSTGKYKEEKTN